jgi:hypothetical protein
MNWCRNRFIRFRFSPVDGQLLTGKQLTIQNLTQVDIIIGDTLYGLCHACTYLCCTSVDFYDTDFRFESSSKPFFDRIGTDVTEMEKS